MPKSKTKTPPELPSQVLKVFFQSTGHNTDYDTETAVAEFLRENPKYRIAGSPGVGYSPNVGGIIAVVFELKP